MYVHYDSSCVLLQVGQASLRRSLHLEDEEELLLLHSQIPTLEALMYCVQMNWMAILVRVIRMTAGMGCMGTLCEEGGWPILVRVTHADLGTCVRREEGGGGGSELCTLQSLKFTQSIHALQSGVSGHSV